MALLESLKLPLVRSIVPFNLRDADGHMVESENFKHAKVFVVVFMCNHCPYVQAVWPRLVDLQEKYKNNGVQFIGINPNLNPDYPEETPEKMKEYAARYHMNFPYLLDVTQEVARAYKAQCTPDIYVYDQGRKLAYHGRIDDNWKEADKANTHELSDALAALVKGEQQNVDQYPSMGCSIKWLA